MCRLLCEITGEKGERRCGVMLQVREEEERERERENER
jgi:hypothetical protein